MVRVFPPLTSGKVLRKLRELTAPKEGEKYFINRNPRNLERLRIAYKPAGYHLDNPVRMFWHRLEINISGRHVGADIKHFINGPVVTASTSEWSIKKHLFKTNDTAAFVNLARVLAARCLQSGITEVACQINPVANSKVDKFLNVLRDNGLALMEPERFVAPRPWDACRYDKPWEVIE